MLLLRRYATLMRFDAPVFTPLSAASYAPHATPFYAVTPPLRDEMLFDTPMFRAPLLSAASVTLLPLRLRHMAEARLRESALRSVIEQSRGEASCASEWRGEARCAAAGDGSR